MLFLKLSALDIACGIAIALSVAITVSMICTLLEAVFYTV